MATRADARRSCSSFVSMPIFLENASSKYVVAERFVIVFVIYCFIRLSFLSKRKARQPDHCGATFDKIYNKLKDLRISANSLFFLA